MKTALQSDNVEEIKAKTEALKQASYKIAEELYKQQAAQNGGAGANPGTGAAGNGSNAGAGSGPSGFDKGQADDVEYDVKDDNK